MKKKLILMVLIVILAAVLMAGCVPGDGSYHQGRRAGFLWGIWHGWVAPVSLVLGLFNSDIRVYEVMNTGWWYDFGFYMAIIGGFGGLALFRKRKDKKG